MRLVQYRDRDGRRAVAASVGDELRTLEDIETVYELALETIESERTLAATASTYIGNQTLDFVAAEREGRVLPPLEHPVPTRCWVTACDGNGDWFFRGNGSTLVGAGQPLPMPPFATSASPAPQLGAYFVIAEDGTPCRVGWVLGHPLTDAATVAGPGAGHARLRASAAGPELVLGELPEELPALARVRRAGEIVREARLALGAGARKLADLTALHFRYGVHRRPGDVHLHFFAGAGALEVTALPEDICELEAAALGRVLRNRVVAVKEAAEPPAVRVL